MRFRRAAVVLLAGVSTAGCSVLGFHRSDADMPSQVALSLYADPDANPNADALPPDTSAPAMQTPDMAAVTVDPQAKDGPYLVNLSGTSKTELAKKIKALLDYLQTQDDGGAVSRTSFQITSPPGNSYVPLPTSYGKVAAGAAGLVAPPLPVSSIPSIPGLFAVQPSWTANAPVTEGATAHEPASIRAGNAAPVATNQPARAPALGQYAEGPSVPSSTAQRDDADGGAVGTPVTFKILQLKDDSVFLNADQNALLKDLKKTLGSSYVDDDDYVLQPGQFKYVDFETINKKTRYLAVLANFHDQTHGVSKQVMRIEAGGYKYSLLVMFRDLEVRMVDESHHQPPKRKP